MFGCTHTQVHVPFRVEARGQHHCLFHTHSILLRQDLSPVTGTADQEAPKVGLVLLHHCWILYQLTPVPNPEKCLYAVHIQPAAQCRVLANWTLRRQSRGLRFCCQHPHGSLQLSLTLMPGDLIPSSGLLGHQAGTRCIHMPM